MVPASLCLGLVGGEQGAQQPVVQFGVEDGDLDAVGGQDVAVGVVDPAGQAGQAQSPQVIGDLARTVWACSKPVIKARRLLLVMPVGLWASTRDAVHGGQLRPLVRALPGSGIPAVLVNQP